MVWQRVIPLSEVPLGTARAQGEILVCRTGEEEFRALENCCSHADVPLGDQDLQDGQVACPAHGARFDVTTGAACRAPAPVGIDTYPARIKDDWVEVDLED